MDASPHERGFPAVPVKVPGYATEGERPDEGED